MREIKFRVFLKDTGKYINEGVDIGMLSLPKNWETYFILEQYTGLKDKNGVEIYKGDKIRFIGGQDRGVGVMESVLKNINIQCSWISKNFTDLYTSIDYLGCSDELEIIGNIHKATP